MTVQTDGLTGIPYLDYDDYLAGKNAIMYFHNKMCDLYSNYTLTFQNLLLGLNSRGNKFFVDGLGLGIIENPDVSQSTVKNAMEYLAVKSQGRIPTAGSFTQAIADQEQAEFHFGDISAFVALTTAKQVLAESEKQAEKVIEFGSQAIGETATVAKSIWDKSSEIVSTAADSTISILGTAKYVIPLVIIGGVLLYVYLMPKRG